MFLVECGVLPPAVTDGGISLELGCHLGHGNVLVFLDRNDRSTTLVRLFTIGGGCHSYIMSKELDDGRRWQPPLRMSVRDLFPVILPYTNLDCPQGLYIYRDCDESSKLYRMVLTARKNTIIDDCGMSWHLGVFVLSSIRLLS